jgi:Uma2 family endonuclease
VIAQRLTFAEFECLPDHEGKRELIDGEVIELSPPDLKHSQIARRLFRLLDPLVIPEIGELYQEAGYRMGGRWLVPDVSIANPWQPQGKYLEGGPLLAVEIISEGNRACDIERKLMLYLEHGTKEVWIIYPETRTLHLWRSDGAARHTGKFRALGRWEIDLAELLK